MEWLRAFSMSKARAATAKSECVRVALGLAARVTMTQGVTHWLAGVNAYISNRLFFSSTTIPSGAFAVHVHAALHHSACRRIGGGAG
jgi:hypothetical protein